jgi:hypothetical protein
MIAIITIEPVGIIRELPLLFLFSNPVPQNGGVGKWIDGVNTKFTPSPQPLSQLWEREKENLV